MSKDDFITRAKVFHGEKFDYSAVEYKNMSSKVEIICPNHGPYWQVPKSHLKGYGCKKCSYGDTASFIEKAKIVHGDRYDYSQVDYEHSLKNIILICPEHGIFEQLPYNHLRGNGCSSCGSISMKKKKTLKQEQWIEKAQRVHGDRYEYSEVVYKKAMDKVMIRCLEHGIFEQVAHSHLEGYGCPFCSGVIRTTQRFIEKASEKQPHGKFDYQHTFYVNSTTPVIISCVEHGPFTQMPSDHIRGGNGCPKCQSSSPECKWLDSLGVPERQVRIKTANATYVVDGFDPKTNTVYEFDGDFWHGNPNIYRGEEINKINGLSFKALYQRTLTKQHNISLAGYKIVSIWESEWKSRSI